MVEARTVGMGGEQIVLTLLHRVHRDRLPVCARVRVNSEQQTRKAGKLIFALSAFGKIRTLRTDVMRHCSRREMKTIEA